MKNLTSAGLLNMLGCCQDALQAVTIAATPEEKDAIARKALGVVSPVIEQVNADRIQKNVNQIPAFLREQAS